MFTYIVTSDIHLGHLKTTTTHIISSFKKYILNDLNKNINILFISGDLFDRLLDLNSKEVYEIIEFFNYLLNYCYKYNIFLRILEGTPSHDWQQSTILLKINEIRKEKVNLKYFKTLDIEYIEEYNKYILYIPDEWTNDHIDLEKQIQEKLNILNIEKVDIAILHGQFKYQTLNKKYNGFYFKEEYFLNLVRSYIHIGHYHTFSTFDRIIANGSLERLAHGEEEPKGYIKVEDNKYVFIENKNAYIYKTINITDKFTLEKLDKIIFEFPKKSYIRLVVSKNSYFNLNFDSLKIRYLDYSLKKIIKENLLNQNSIIYIINENNLEFNNSYLLENNIYDILVNIINEKYFSFLTSSKINKLQKYLNLFSNVSDIEKDISKS